MSDYDTIIIGGGPAGLSAGIYAMRARLKTLLIERLMPGGQMMIADYVENYPGFPNGISGGELSAAMEQQARNLGLEIISSDITEVDFGGPAKTVKTSTDEYAAPALIIASGANPRKLGVPGEVKFTGRGVSYCAVCDGALFRDKEIAVIGGGNTAIQDAVFLTRFAKKVTVVHRRDKLRACKMLSDRLLGNEKVDVAWDSIVKEIRGNNAVESIELQNVKTGETREIPVNGVFVLIGTDPSTEYLKGHVKMDEAGYVITDEEMKTDVPGVFAAGDCRKKSVRQMVTAAADGAIAAINAEQYLESLSDEESGDSCRL